MYEPCCQPQGTCNIDQRAYRAILARNMADTIRMYPPGAAHISTQVANNAWWAAAACNTSTNGTVLCGSDWTSGVYDGRTGVGEQLSTWTVVLGLLMRKSRPLSMDPAAKNATITAVPIILTTSDLATTSAPQTTSVETTTPEATTPEDTIPEVTRPETVTPGATAPKTTTSATGYSNTEASASSDMATQRQPSRPESRLHSSLVSYAAAALRIAGGWSTLGWATMISLVCITFYRLWRPGATNRNIVAEGNLKDGAKAG